MEGLHWQHPALGKQLPCYRMLLSEEAASVEEWTAAQQAASEPHVIFPGLCFMSQIKWQETTGSVPLNYLQKVTLNESS